MINKIKARGIVYERKGKKVNWCVLVVWTIHDQLCRLQSLDVDLLGKPRHVVDLDRFEELDKKEEEDPMPTSSMLKRQNQQQFFVLRESQV
jgi:hypothetical protein